MRFLHSIVCLGGSMLAAAVIVLPVRGQTSLEQTTAPASLTLTVGAAPLWMRYPAISPDGKTVVFSFRGHLFTVPASGGAALPLTAGPAHETNPTWSPDGQNIAYASDAYGNFDVYVIPARGGTPKRLTTFSTNEVPTGFAPDNKNVLFSGHRQDSKNNAQFPGSSAVPELYRVSIEPGRAPDQILTTPALAARYNRAGDQIIYEDLKGSEDPWRKHEKTSITHDIWLYDAKTGTHTKLTDYVGEDRNPIWSPDEKSVYYLRGCLIKVSCQSFEHEFGGGKENMASLLTSRSS